MAGETRGRQREGRIVEIYGEPYATIAGEPLEVNVAGQALQHAEVPPELRLRAHLSDEDDRCTSKGYRRIARFPVIRRERCA